MKPEFAAPLAMQNLLFAELSRMFGQEVPLYDKSLLVNQRCNEVICDFLRARFPVFAITDAELEQTSGERHGAIRIGRPDEYCWVARFFAAFGMLPHDFYDMTNLGAKSQPIIATAFRTPLHPEHRVFCSLLMTDYFDATTRRRIELRLAQRTVFSSEAKKLIQQHEAQGGLDWTEAKALIAEGTERIFKWTGQARDHQLYQDLAQAGFKIAADIACFDSHHLNHLTPNTLWIDLYTTAMKFCLGELSTPDFRSQATHALEQLMLGADQGYLRLHFKHLSDDVIEACKPVPVPEAFTGKLRQKLLARLQRPEFHLEQLNQAGFKEFTEGPAVGIPILLRQDSYKALTEAVVFTELDGRIISTTHTARFGEIEQRFYATTSKGRAWYDQGLAKTNALRQQQSKAIKIDFATDQKAYAECFAAFPRTLPELLAQGLVYGHYQVTSRGRAAVAAGSLLPTDLRDLIELGWVRVAGIRYEDFLPFSAAGIFASNLGQYGTKSTATARPAYSQAQLEQVMHRAIIDTDVLYRGQEAESILQVYRDLQLLPQLPPEQLQSWECAAGAYRALIKLAHLESNTQG